MDAQGAPRVKTTTRTRGRLACLCAGLALVVSAGNARAEDPDPAITAGGNRSFFHWDLNVSAFYSARGADLVGTDSSHWQPTDRIPRNYLGWEYIGTLGENSWLRRLLGPLELTTIDLNPHIEVDFNPTTTPSLDSSRVEWRSTSFDINSADRERTTRIKLVLHDFWLRFEPSGMERTSLRVGHFDIPYGINPIMAPRGGVFVMPPEIDDIGMKKDWGAVWKGPAGEYDYELALTTGSGLGMHSPHWFDDSQPAAFVTSARIGAPTYWNFQYGLSALYGKIPQLMADQRTGSRALSRWRVGIDGFYKLQQHTMFMSQVGLGQNGDDPGDPDTGRDEVLAAHALVDHIPPRCQSLDLKAQVKTVIYDLAADQSDRTSLLLELAWSLATPLMLRLDYVHDFDIPAAMPAMGMKADDRVYLTINYYE